MKPGSGEAARVEALCFDMDGVLIQSRTVIERAWSRSAAHNGVTLTTETIRDHIHGRPGSHTLAFLFGHLPHDRQRTIKAEVDAYEETADCDLVPGVRDLLVKLKRAGVPVALVTSSWPRRIAFVLERHGLQDGFDAVVHRDDVLRGKPDPSCYRLAAERLGRPAARCLVFEDSESGVEAALRSGAACVGIGLDPSAPLPGILARCADFTTIDLAPCPDDADTQCLAVGATVVPLAAAPGATSS